jgi:hypothetical protein
VAETADTLKVRMDFFVVLPDVFDGFVAEGAVEKVLWTLAVDFREFGVFVLLGVGSAVSLQKRPFAKCLPTVFKFTLELSRLLVDCQLVSIQSRLLPEAFITENADEVAMAEVDDFLMFVEIEKEFPAVSAFSWALDRRFPLSRRNISVASHVSIEFVSSLELNAAQAAGEIVRDLVRPFVLGEISLSVVRFRTFTAEEVASVLVMG